MPPVLLITRPEPSGAEFALSVITALGRPVQTILSPLIGIVPLPVAAPGRMPAGLVLTSVHGAEAAGRIGLPPGTPAWCVGERTAQAARDAGLHAISAKGDAAALVAMILDRRPPGPLLHLRGEHVSGDLSRDLSAGGVPCDEMVCYRQDALPLSGPALAVLQGSDPVIAPLFSPRTGSILAQNAPFSAPLTCVAISPAVAAEARARAFGAVVVADRPDAAAMVAATCRAIAENSVPTSP